MTDSVRELLDDVQRVMTKAGVWQSMPPAPEKMMSVEPFSIDTLSFTEWLQWVYVARLRAIIDANGQLPSGAQVHPYAIEALKANSQSIPELLELIEKLDQVLA